MLMIKGEKYCGIEFHFDEVKFIQKKMLCTAHKI